MPMGPSTRANCKILNSMAREPTIVLMAAKGTKGSSEMESMMARGPGIELMEASGMKES